MPLVNTQLPSILVTGASGFIGSHLIEAALDRNWTVYAAVRGTSSRKALADPRIRFFAFDLNLPGQWEGNLQSFAEEHGGFDYVVHNAGVTKPRHPAEFEVGNADATKHFAGAVMKTQPGLKKFVYISSIAALGPGEDHSGVRVSEGQRPVPLTPYGQSKLLAEQYLEEIPSLPYVVVRPSAVYGPRDVKFFERLMGLLKKGIDIRLGPDNQRLGFIHVSDLVDGVLLACTNKNARTSYILSEGRAYPQSAFNEFMKQTMDVKARTIRISKRLLIGIGYLMFYAGKVTGRPVHLSQFKMRELTALNWDVDIAKAQRELQFSPKFDLEKGIASTYAWYRSQSGPEN